MDKQSKIIEMFDDIATTYDRANRVMSMGIDVLWRKEACVKAFEILNNARGVSVGTVESNGNLNVDSNLKETEKAGCLPFKTQHNSETKAITIADIACGTGDMMLQWEAKARALGVKVEKIIGIDPSSRMLEMARKKINKDKIPSSDFILAKADRLPLQDSSVDILSIAYGLRNVINRTGALSEFSRVLRRGGVVVVLEFMALESKIESKLDSDTDSKINHGIDSSLDSKNGLFRATLKNTLFKNTFGNTFKSVATKTMQFYTKKILPFVGGAISRNFKAYRYLPDSIDGFITRDALEMELERHNMPVLFSKDYSARVSSLVVGKKC